MIITLINYVRLLLVFGHPANLIIRHSPKFTTTALGGGFLSHTKKAIPILFTPVSRRKFKDGKAVETHAEYTPLVKEVAKNLNVALIDLDAKSLELYQQMGEEDSKLLFNQVAPGEHPNYPEGKIDNTHFNELGARKIAEIVLAELKNLNLDLTNHIVKLTVKK